MGLSILVAKMLALIYISVGVGMLSGKFKDKKIIEDFENSPGLTYFAGMITLILGMLLVGYHNIWIKNWTLVITLIGWLILLKGIMLIAFPQCISFFKGWYKYTRTSGLIFIAFGLLCGYFGFMLQ